MPQYLKLKEYTRSGNFSWKVSDCEELVWDENQLPVQSVSRTSVWKKLYFKRTQQEDSKKIEIKVDREIKRYLNLILVNFLEPNLITNRRM